ncbi:PRC-barrel domain-containing protein [Candidatus Peregrinibacteria bacterium]|nr:PRC-barrel domain-containing protein [Candidatus Peregrinibacteria bacterium]
MIHQRGKIIGTPVLGFADGQPLGIVEDVIIHPDTGKVEALWVKPLTLPYAHAVLPVEGILSWKKHLYVSGEGALSEPDEVIRIAETLSRKEGFVGNRVRNESGKGFGRVYDLDFDTRNMTLRYLFVDKSFLGFRFQRRFFHYDSVVQVLPDAIVVKDEEIKVEKEPILADEGQPVLEA